VPVAFTACIPAAHVFAFATEPVAPRRISGWMIGSRNIFHFRPGDQSFSSAPSGQSWPSAIITVPFEVMAAVGPGVVGGGSQTPLNDDRLYRAPEAALARLVGLMRDVARLAEETPWIAEASEPARALAGTIMVALLACLAGGRAVRDRAAPGRHRRIVARLERAMRERPEEMLSLPDLCAEVGAAERTLNLACQEFLGEGAMQFARARRLDHVRAALLASDPGATRVTEVAMRFGFWELGRFAAAYRLRFGESPSETVRRRNGQIVHARIA
jgi:AraC-like DNA-binding protein